MSKQAELKLSVGKIKVPTITHYLVGIYKYWFIIEGAVFTVMSRFRHNSLVI